MSDVITQLTERESIVTEMKYLYLLCLICQNPLIKVTVIRSVQTNLFVINFCFLCNNNTESVITFYVLNLKLVEDIAERKVLA